MGSYVNDSSLFAIGITFPVICTAAVGTRFAARRSKGMQLLSDDWISLVAVAFTIICGALVIAGGASHAIKPPQAYSSATHQRRTSDRNEQNGIVSALEYGFIPISCLSISSIRLAFILLYRRLFPFGKKTNRVYNTLIIAVSAWGLAFFGALLFKCAPYFGAVCLNRVSFTKYCETDYAISAAMGITDVFFDLCILALPMVPVWRLQLSIRKRLIVTTIFALGIFSIAAGMARVILLMQMLAGDCGSSGKLFGLVHGNSQAISVSGTGIWWTYMEIGVGCLVSQLPALGMLRSELKNPFHRLFILVPSSIRSALSSSEGSCNKTVAGEEENLTEKLKNDRNLYFMRSFRIESESEESQRTQSTQISTQVTIQIPDIELG